MKTTQEQTIEGVAKDLKELIQKPEWADYVKTGVHKERPPKNDDWWYIRAASVLRTIYLRGPIGVSKLRTKYGGLKNRGVKPNVFRRGSGSIIRHILQELEQAELVKQEAKGVHKGRVTTPKGISLLFKHASKNDQEALQEKKKSSSKKKASAEKTEKKE